MHVKEIMTLNAEPINAMSSIAEAAEKMERLNVGALIVEEDNELVGVVTDRDITVRAVAHKHDPEKARVRDIMTTEIVACSEDDDLEKAAELMETRKVRRLPVRNSEGLITGILSLGDLAMSTSYEKTGEVLQAISGIAHPER